MAAAEVERLGEGLAAGETAALLATATRVVAGLAES